MCATKQTAAENVRKGEKMTYEEALFYAKSYMRVNDVPVNARETTKCIVEALEKQIPKKPIEEWSNSPFSEDRGCKFLHLMCPNCKKMEVCKMEYFCPRCGQRLDFRSDI